MNINNIKEKAIKADLRYFLMLANVELKLAGKAKDRKTFAKHMKSFRDCQDIVMNDYKRINNLNKQKIVKCRVRVEGAEA